MKRTINNTYLVENLFIVNKLEKGQQKLYKKRTSAYLHLHKKFERSKQKIRSWDAKNEDIEQFSVTVYAKNPVKNEILTQIKNEDGLIDTIELYLFRIRDLLAILFDVTAIASGISNKGNGLNRVRGSEGTDKILNRLKDRETVWLSEEFDKFIKSSIKVIELIIDMRNSLKLNGTGHLVLKDGKVYFSQKQNLEEGKALRSELKGLGAKPFDNWLIPLDAFVSTMPETIDQYVFHLNNFKQEAQDQKSS